MKWTWWTRMPITPCAVISGWINRVSMTLLKDNDLLHDYAFSPTKLSTQVHLIQIHLKKCLYDHLSSKLEI